MITHSRTFMFTLASTCLLSLAACGAEPADADRQSNAFRCAANAIDVCMCLDGTMRQTMCNTTGDALLECPCNQPPAGTGGMGAGTTAGTIVTNTGGAGTSGASGMTGGAGGAAGAIAGTTGGSAGTMAGTMAGMMAGTTGGAAGTTAGTMAMTDSGTGDSLDELRQVCVDTINMYRETLSLPALTRANATQEMCSDDGAKQDADNDAPHSSAGQCMGLGAQDTCPGWGIGGFSGNATVADALKSCLAAMWAEGEPPVSRSECINDYQNCFLKYGHYLNMSDPNATVVACGFYEMPGMKWWMNQDFGR